MTNKSHQKSTQQLSTEFHKKKHIFYGCDETLRVVKHGELQR